MTGGGHPLHAPYREWLADGLPDAGRLTTWAAERNITTADGLPLRFLPPPDDGLGYEARIAASGIVATRPGNWHDAFNALVWLRFPRAKAVLSARHAERLGEAGGGRRGAARDVLTQFDECGVIVAGMPDDLEGALRAHRWREVFAERRAELMATTCFVVFGHGSLDALQAPFVGLCGKALFVGPADEGDDLDAALARRLASADFSTATRDALQPLPLLGIPGATPDNDDPAYYDEPRQFRPPRTMAAGSPPGSR